MLRMPCESNKCNISVLKLCVLSQYAGTMGLNETSCERT